jgi:transposase
MNIYLTALSDYLKGIIILLIMDQAGWHTAKDLIIPDNIRILYLPPYSPELNPVEKLWEWLKKEIGHNFFYKSLDDMSDATCIEYNKLDNQSLKKLCNCKYLSYYN